MARPCLSVKIKSGWEQGSGAKPGPACTRLRVEPSNAAKGKVNKNYPESKGCSTPLWGTGRTESPWRSHLLLLCWCGVSCEDHRIAKGRLETCSSWQKAEGGYGRAEGGGGSLPRPQPPRPPGLSGFLECPGDAAAIMTPRQLRSRRSSRRFPGAAASGDRFAPAGDISHQLDLGSA